MRVFDVFDADGKQLAIFISDMYARDSKRGGAWMNSYVSQSALTGYLPVVANHLNIPKPPAGKPTLLTWDEVTTAVPRVRPRAARHVLEREVPLLHRHQRAARLRRISVAGQRDVGRLAGDAANYAKHYQTGAPMPQELLDKVIASLQVQPGLHDHRVPGRGHARPALAPDRS